MNFYPSSQSPAKRQFGLDLIRAVAIGFVLLSHFAKTIDYLGFWGVELFFALSGYLIGHILWRSFSKSDNWSGAQIINFWSRRWWRTLPSYYLFLFISLALAYLFSEPLPPTAILTKFIWFGQSFTKHYTWFYPVSWSLCIEEWFYLLFPLLLLLFTQCNLKAKTAFILAILTIFIGCAGIRYLLISKYIVSNGGIGTDLRLITIARLDAIATGVLIAYCTATVKSLTNRALTFFIIGMILIIGSIIIPYALGMSFDMIRANPYLLLSAPLGSALILPFCSTMKRPTGRFAAFADTIEKVSLWSYSIYLCHMPILTTIYALQDRFLGPDFRGNVYGNLVTKTVGCVLILIVSAFLYKYFESSFTRRRPAELHFVSKRADVYA
jgi:peptidoglycan/LPS O-acetylase OafA/YrhL